MANKLLVSLLLTVYPIPMDLNLVNESLLIGLFKSIF